MPLHIHSGNRMERLVEALAGVVREPLASPFDQEVIVVQSKGMQRWLAMELAARFGVWANCIYPFPNDMVWRLFRAALPDLPESAPFTPEVMTWTVMGLLSGMLERREFAPLGAYLSDDGDGLKCFQLAQRIADTFDQYTLFRPEMLLEWEAGGGNDWQASLWREIAAKGGGRHRGRLREEFLGTVITGLRGTGEVPERIALFGNSYLPRYHLEILAQTARITEVHLFLLSPTREYWADIVPERKIARLTPAERSLRIEGNPLLASLGRLGRDFSDMVLEMGESAATQEEHYAEPDGDSLLGRVQSDILNLRGAEPGSASRPVAPGDRSVQVHSCHSPMREIEVLHDNLLDLLERVEGLEPRDIVVMTPDIETYAPYISAVFAGSREPSPGIPFSIADRNITCEGRVPSAFLKLLELPGSRVSVPRVLDILESPPVGRCFGLDESELETIRSWIEETRVRWGMDEQDRARLGLPGYRENSWRAGLDRLLLGYAMPDQGGRLFNDILPFDSLEGTAARTLGKFAEFTARVEEVVTGLDRPRTPGAWRDELRALMSVFIAPDDESSRELAVVAEAVEDLGRVREEAGFSGRVSLAVIRSWLTGRLTREQRGLGFMTGGVTFCAMLPMRSIPFRVVALIGMNDGAFPRQSHPPGFDLISREPRRGDRSLRDEDRYLFLEAILSARSCLYLSYVGQSIRDGGEIPPSVLVSEFLDAVDRGFIAADGGKTGELLVTRHRLQAFSSDYFRRGSPLFSYSEENCSALREKPADPWSTGDFLTVPMDAPGEEWRDIPLDLLLRFFVNPARYFLENRLKIRLEDASAPLEEREPFGLDSLDAYLLKQELLETSLRGGDMEELFPVARGRGILPPAHHGRMAFAEVAAQVRKFAATVAETTRGAAPLEPLDFNLELGQFRLSGRLDRILPDRMLRYRCARLKAKDQIRTWIEHLVLNCIASEGYPRATLLLMTDGSRTFSPVGKASEFLHRLLELYREGLTRPLRFFPDSAMEYARKGEWSLERAYRRWNPGFTADGEGADPHFRLCFGRSDPFTDDFVRIARTFFEPLLGHME